MEAEERSAVSGRPPAGEADASPDADRTFSRPAAPELTEGSYRIRFACDAEDVRLVQTLRYEVFNLELEEGLEESHRLGLDQDRFDTSCDHLMVHERETDRLIGTYRMQTFEAAQTGAGFYSGQEFALETLPTEILQRSIELGRACIEKGSRNGPALFALWKGLAAYASWTRKRYLFGCCSLTSQDPLDGHRMHRRLRREGRMHPELVIPTRPTVSCGDEPEGDPRLDEEIDVPRLFATYLRYGAKACGPPALDRDFGTIDFLVVLDLDGLDPRIRQLFFTGLPHHRR